MFVEGTDHRIRSHRLTASIKCRNATNRSTTFPDESELAPDRSLARAHFPCLQAFKYEVDPGFVDYERLHRYMGHLIILCIRIGWGAVSPSCHACSRLQKVSIDRKSKIDLTHPE